MKLTDFTIKHLAKIICGDCGYTPYLSGPRLVELFNRHGSRDTYGQGFPSRWAYTEEKLKAINDSTEMIKLIEEIIDHRNFYDTKFNIEEAVEKVNELLKFDGYIINKVGAAYKVTSFEGIEIQPENIEEIENEYISEQIQKCDQKVLQNDFDGAITNARTLAEAIMVDILKKYKPEYEHKGDLTAAYKNIKALLNLDPAAKDYPESIKQILTGLSSIVNGLATMRNEMSDAHARRYRPEKHHAKLAVNASKTLSEFLLGSLVKQFGKK